MSNANFNNSHLSGGAPYSEEYMRAWSKGNTAPEQDTEKREPYNIDITTIPFDGDITSKMISSMELSGMIADRMSELFSDFEGCIILRDNQYGNPYLVMYFKDKNIINAGDRVKGIEPIINNNQQQNNIANRLQNVLGRNNSRMYKLSNAAKDVLGKLVAVRPRQKLNWNDYFREVPEGNPTMMQNYNILVEVKGFDFQKVLSMIYGNTIKVKDPDTDKDTIKKVQYSISIMKPLTQMSWNTNAVTTNFQLSIGQLNQNNVQELAQKFGYGVVAQNSIPMYRSKMN